MLWTPKGWPLQSGPAVALHLHLLQTQTAGSQQCEPHASPWGHGEVLSARAQSNMSLSARCLAGGRSPEVLGCFLRGTEDFCGCKVLDPTYAESKVESESSDSTSGRSQEPRTVVHQ